jgi:hypothetical protein
MPSDPALRTANLTPPPGVPGPLTPLWVALTGMLPPAVNSLESAGVWRLHQLWVRGRRVLAGPARAGSAFFWGARCGPKSLWRFYISICQLPKTQGPPW